MSVQTSVYLYNQRQLVYILETITAGASRSYEKVYSKTLTINRGVDNVLEFQFLNQNQKPVNITGKNITCRLLNQSGTEVLLQKTLTPTLPVNGLTTLQLTSGEIEKLEPQYCYYSLEIPSGQQYVANVMMTGYGSGYLPPVDPLNVPTVTFVGGGGVGATGVPVISDDYKIIGVTMTSGGRGYTSPPTVVFSAPPNTPGILGTVATGQAKMAGNEAPVFLDDNAGARGQIKIVNSVLPTFVPAQNITIPSHVPPRPNDPPDGRVYYSSVINTTEIPSVTIQSQFDNFTGNVQLEGSTLQDFQMYYNIGPVHEYNNNGTIANVIINNATQPTGNPSVGYGFGYFTCDDNAFLTAARSITVTGTPTGTGAIIPYSPTGTEYFIISTNGANTFTLSTQNPLTQSQGTPATPVSTVPGTTTGMTFTINGYTGTQGYNVDGYHPFVRMKITNVGTNMFNPTANNQGYLNGDVVRVLSRTARPANLP